MYKNKWKGIKWINTRFANHYRAELFMVKAQASAIIAAGVAQINIIKQAQGNPGKKAIAIFKQQRDTLEAVRHCIKNGTDKANKRWRI